MKYESQDQPGLFYWAERCDLGNMKAFVVLAQAEGYPQTTAYDDWCSDFEGANQVAQLLAKGEL
jgi:hypothetical protein